jgi:hypothetical protein
MSATRRFNITALIFQGKGVTGYGRDFFPINLASSFLQCMEVVSYFCVTWSFLSASFVASIPPLLVGPSARGAITSHFSPLAA